MSKYYLTPFGYNQLRILMGKYNERYEEILKDGFASGAEQDGHHDEGFQLSLSASSVQSKRLQELQDIYRNAEIIEPEEQDEIVKIGNAVIIKYPDNTTEKFILDGYLVAYSGDNRISLQSPIGKILIRSKIGDKKTFTIENKKIEFVIIKIIKPSEV